MNNKILKNIGNGLYLLACILLLTNIFLMSSNQENKAIEFGAWSTLMIAAIYGIWLGTKNKKD